MDKTSKRKRPEKDTHSKPISKKGKLEDDIDKDKQSQASDGIFTSLHFLVIESGLGKTKAELFKRQITKNSGQLVSEFLEGDSLYVLVDDSVKVQRICEILQISEQPNIFKTHVLRIQWVTACLKNKKLVDSTDYRVNFSEIQKVGDDKDPHLNLNKAGNQNDKSGESNIFPKSGEMWRSKNKRKPGADSETLNGTGSDYTNSEEETPVVDNEQATTSSKKTVAPGHWICAHSSANKKENCNKHITDKLQELAAVYESTNDRWRAMGYGKAIAALKRHSKEITSFEEAKAIHGVGAKLAEKIWEIVESGELRKLNELSDQEEVKALKLFTGIWGAGASTARSWIQAGFRTLDDIRDKASLTRNQKIGLNYYDELLDRMSRAEAAEIEAKVIEAAMAINPGLICMACGSYRRGKVTCGDVDVLITHPDGKSHKGIFSKILTSLRDSGFITDDLVTQEDSGNQTKYLGVCLLPGENKKHRRLDIIVVPYEEFACALMYFTGSAHFNRSMRHLAGKMNMSLSEHSLNKGVVRLNGKKINKGIPLSTPDEDSVFKHLGLKYRPPIERDH